MTIEGSSTHKEDDLLPQGHGDKLDGVEARDRHGAAHHEQGVDVGDLVLLAGPIARVEDARDDERDKDEGEEVQAVEIEVGGWE